MLSRFNFFPESGRVVAFEAGAQQVGLSIIPRSSEGAAGGGLIIAGLDYMLGWL